MFRCLLHQLSIPQPYHLAPSHHLLWFQQLPSPSASSHHRFSSVLQCPIRPITLSCQQTTYKDDSTLYPRLSSAAIATYRELNALEASVQDKLCGLVLLTLTNDKLDNIINEELELTQADKHRLATDEKYVQSSLSHHLAFHPIQVSVKLHQRLSSGLPTCLLAKQPMINFSSSWVFLEPMQMHHPELVQLYSSAQNSDFTSHLNKVVSFVSARPSKYLCSQARIVLIALLFHLMYTDFPPVNQLVSASVSSLVSNPGGQFLLFEHDTILLIIILLADFNSD
ncbi:hypothetical protein MJO29_015708 [Puccinia striiformis f. sp. tritici]|nr:hypothetical protein MJO29_015708 [Puccinia striiformis f. sp. tritici]